MYGAASWNRTKFSGSSDQREDHLHQSGIVVLIAGFEPAASDLPSQRSSPDLYQHVMEGGTGFEPVITISKTVALDPTWRTPSRRGTCSWVRTRDLSIIGRMLYQLS